MAKRDTIHRKLLMTQEEGTLWNEFKAGLGPIYPGYRSFDTYMNWLKEKLKGYGCVDFLEHHWIHKTYRVKDWPQREEGVMKLDVEGKEIPVGTFVQLAPSTGPEGLTAPMVYYDIRKGEPDAGAFAGKIVVMEEPQLPQPPYDEKFLESYTITDTNYRSGPKPPADILECPAPSVSTSWATRWSSSSWACPHGRPRQRGADPVGGILRAGPQYAGHRPGGQSAAAPRRERRQNCDHDLGKPVLFGGGMEFCLLASR